MDTIEFLSGEFNIIEGPKPTCKILVNKYGEKRFLKYPRDDSTEGFKEIIREFIADKLHRYIASFHRDSLIERINGKLGLVLLYCDIDWNKKVSNPEIKVINESEFASALAIDYLIGQTDRPVGRPDHVGLKSADGGDYLFILLDNGNWDPSQPEAYCDKSFIASLFFANQSFIKSQLEEGITKIKQIPRSTLADEVAHELLVKSFWSVEQREAIFTYCDQVALYLKERAGKLDLLLQWYDETHPPEQVIQVPETDQGVVAV